MMHDKLCRTFLSAMLALALVAAFAGCGKDRASEPEAAAPNEKTLADPENPDVPQPINAWGEFSGNDVLLHWIDGTDGDYNRDGDVDGKDVFPLAVRFNKHTDYQAPGLAEEPGDNCIDGNRDGVIDGLDLFVIAVNFNAKVRGYRIYDSLDDAELTELTSAEVPIDSGDGFCRPELEWTAESKGTEEGYHQFYITAQADYEQPAPEEGTVVPIEIHLDPGIPPGAIWPALLHDNRNSYRSPFRGPRTVSQRTVQYYEYSNGEGAAKHGVIGSSGTPLFGFHTSVEGDIDNELATLNQHTGDINWIATNPVADLGVLSLHLLETGGYVAVSQISDGAYVQYILSDEGQLVETVDLQAGLDKDIIVDGTTMLTPSQNLFGLIKLGEDWKFLLWNLAGEEIWNAPTGLPFTYFDAPPIALSNDLIIVGDRGNLIALRESDGGEEWSYPILTVPDDIQEMELALSADKDDNIYFALYYRLFSDTHQLGLFGVVDPEGQEISLSEQIQGRLDQFIPLDDGTAIVLYKEYPGATGHVSRVNVDTLEPIWDKSGNLYRINAIDNEGYLYLSSVTSGVFNCLAPDGELAFSWHDEGSYVWILAGGDLLLKEATYDRFELIPAFSPIINN